MNKLFKPKNKKQHGFTIVELLVAIVVFAILVPVLASLVSLLDSINDRARDMSVINALVENKVEGLRSISFTGLSDGTTTFTTELPATVAAPRSASYVISSVNSTLKQIDIAIYYNDHGQTRSLSYRTYIGELGVAQY